MKTAFILKENSRWGSCCTTVFLTYKRLIKYISEHPEVTIEEDRIYAFDQYGNCGYMVLREHRKYPDEPTEVLKHYVYEVECFE